MGLLERIQLGRLVEHFRSPSDRVERVSLAWWEDGEAEFVPEGTDARTVALLWPTDDEGWVDTKAVQCGEVKAVEWLLTRHELEVLARRHVYFPLDKHDLLVGRGKIGPCPNTFRSIADRLGINVQRLIAPVIARLRGEGAPTVPPRDYADSKMTA